MNGQIDSAQYYARLSKNEILLRLFTNDRSGFKKLILKTVKEPGNSAGEIAHYYTIAGDKDSAFVWLNKSVEQKEYGGLKYLAISPEWDPLRNDPRFALILQNSGIR